MSFARKDKVRILRQESYWFNQIGEIVSIDKSPAMRYPVTVKFEKCDFKAARKTLKWPPKEPQDPKRVSN